MTRMTRTMDEAYAFIERFEDKFDSFELTPTNEGIVVHLFNKES